MPFASGVYLRRLMKQLGTQAFARIFAQNNVTRCMSKVSCVVDHYGNWSLVAAAAVANGNDDGEDSGHTR